MIAVVFGQPSAGRLPRDVRHGAGTPDDGARYYTNAASDGTYHVSPPSTTCPRRASGQVTIPMTLLTQQGQEWEDTLTVAVTSKTHSDQFTDVNEATVGTWAANAVDFAYHFGLVNGTGEDTFSPSGNMTRAQLVTVLYRAVGSPTMTITTNFEDLDVGAYYYSAVVWANFHGIVNGTSDTTFSPNDFITREQLGCHPPPYARAYGGDLSHTGDLSAFTDQNLVSEYAREAMTWAVDKGSSPAWGGDTLAPRARPPGPGGGDAPPLPGRVTPPYPRPPQKGEPPMKRKHPLWFLLPWPFSCLWPPVPARNLTPPPRKTPSPPIP